MPHEIFNLSWAEWAAIIAIISGVFVGFNHMLKSFKDSIMEPFNQRLHDLSISINKFTDSAEHEHTAFDKKLDKHNDTLIRHEAEIGFLYEKNGLKRRKSDED